ncbi:hypothetical protein ZIOFF_059946 [Zingiber officinale]|uniref:Ribosome biogenesis protein SLX9 n=1 Tax=Zingiber officinale TaxID=94328 RepID=A0A8J5KKR6_ZINOF|nr:hypothetical protein ZIOFF_059946 [Zingiber officinale]
MPAFIPSYLFSSGRCRLLSSPKVSRILALGAIAVAGDTLSLDLRPKRKRYSLLPHLLDSGGSNCIVKRWQKKKSAQRKVKDAVVSLSAKKSIGKKKRERRQRKLKAYDLSALSEFLPDLNTIQRPISSKNSKPNSKDRQKLVQIEGAHLKRVLDDPVFQMDPLAAIHEHLRRTQPPPETVKEWISGKKQSKKKKKKPSSGSQLMDI